MIDVDSWIVKAFIFCFRYRPVNKKIKNTLSNKQQFVKVCEFVWSLTLLSCASSVTPPISDRIKSGR